VKFQKVYFTLLIFTLGIGGVVASSANQVDAVLPYNKPSQVIIDGIVGQSEYSGGYDEENTGIQISWEHDGELMYIGLVSPMTGWVSIGFGPEGQKMDKASIILGAVDDDSGEVSISDQLVAGRSHSEDNENNVIEYAGTQSGEETTIEFIFPLNSGDNADHSFEMGGTYGFIVASHKTSDNFGDRHNERFAPLTVLIEFPASPTTSAIPEINIASTTVLIILVLFCTVYFTRNRI